jgi:hypothetical protein
MTLHQHDLEKIRSPVGDIGWATFNVGLQSKDGKMLDLIRHNTRRLIELPFIKFLY